MTKVEALAKYLECDSEDLIQSKYNEDVFKLGSKEYLVLTDSEADTQAENEIKESIWAFNSSFLAAHLKEGIDQEVIESIQNNGKCESNNKAILSLIDDVDHFVNDAIKSDGRGHFISSYDGEENEVYQDGEFFYIYRMN